MGLRFMADGLRAQGQGFRVRSAGISRHATPFRTQDTQILNSDLWQTDREGHARGDEDGLGRGVQGVGFGFLGSGFRVQGVGCRVQGVGCRV